MKFKSIKKKISLLTITPSTKIIITVCYQYLVTITISRRLHMINMLNGLKVRVQALVQKTSNE